MGRPDHSQVRDTHGRISSASSHSKCADRLFCHTCGRGRNQHLVIPGRPELLRRREVTAAPVRRVAQNLIAGRQCSRGDADILVVFDAGNDARPWPISRPACRWRYSTDCVRTG